MIKIDQTDSIQYLGNKWRLRNESCSKKLIFFLGARANKMNSEESVLTKIGYSRKEQAIKESTELGD